MTLMERPQKDITTGVQCMRLHSLCRLSGPPSPALSFLCRGDVVICLSTTVRNDTLQDVKEQRVSLRCRKQLRVEELEMVRDVHSSVFFKLYKRLSDSEL